MVIGKTKQKVKDIEAMLLAYQQEQNVLIQRIVELEQSLKSLSFEVENLMESGKRQKTGVQLISEWLGGADEFEQR